MSWIVTVPVLHNIYVFSLPFCILWFGIALTAAFYDVPYPLLSFVSVWSYRRICLAFGFVPFSDMYCSRSELRKIKMLKNKNSK